MDVVLGLGISLYSLTDVKACSNNKVQVSMIGRFWRHALKEQLSLYSVLKVVGCFCPVFAQQLPAVASALLAAP